MIRFVCVWLTFAGMFGSAQADSNNRSEAMPFGKGGQKKMLYDRRQRPQAVYLDGKVHLVFNGGGKDGNDPSFKTTPMASTYDPETRSFSKTVTLGKRSKDHHYGPVIWADDSGHLHVLSGCHRTPGTHLISKKPGSIGKSLEDWRVGAQIAESISYPTVYNIEGGKEMIYYRVLGHFGHWTYSVTTDSGETWRTPEEAVADMDAAGRFEWSSYQTKLLSQDGRTLHVAFIVYDDCKFEDPDRAMSDRLYNPRYREKTGQDWKYNLYYFQIDLASGHVMNFEGETLKTPIDVDYADQNCLIWDTEWRGSGVPPSIVLDEKGEPAFLHVLSGDDSKQEANYFYVFHDEEGWQKNFITESTHQWNSGHLRREEDGTLVAFLVVGDEYLESDGLMDSHGGGRIEEWRSSDRGMTWQCERDLTPTASDFSGWRFNNLQPVTKPGGEIVPGMLLFYGWGDPYSPQAKAFLIDETR